MKHSLLGIRMQPAFDQSWRSLEFLVSFFWFSQLILQVFSLFMRILAFDQLNNILDTDARLLLLREHGSNQWR